MATVLNLNTLCSADVEIPMGASEFCLQVSPTVAVTLRFARVNDQVVMRIVKNNNILENTLAMTAQAMDVATEPEVVTVAPTKQEEEDYIALPATMPPPTEAVFETHTRFSKYNLQNELGNNKNLAFRNFALCSKYRTLRMILEALASVNNRPSTTDEIFVDMEDKKSFCTQVSNLNGRVSKTNKGVTHSGDTPCRHERPHLVCESGRGNARRFWVDSSIATKVMPWL